MNLKKTETFPVGIDVFTALKQGPALNNLHDIVDYLQS